MLPRQKILSSTPQNFNSPITRALTCKIYLIIMPTFLVTYIHIHMHPVMLLYTFIYRGTQFLHIFICCEPSPAGFTSPCSFVTHCLQLRFNLNFFLFVYIWFMSLPWPFLISYAPYFASEPFGPVFFISPTSLQLLHINHNIIAILILAFF